VSPRTAVLPGIAAALVAVTLGAQIRAGGGDFGPPRSADPCRPRPVEPVSRGIEGLSEQLVLLGVDGAACRLHLSREALVLALAQEDEVGDAEVEAVRGGLRDAVDRLDRERRLPRASSLTDEALEEADLPGLAKRAIRALPDSLIDNRLKTDEVLRRTVADLDVRRVLDNLDDPRQVDAAVNRAITGAVRDELIDGLPNPFD
jgi:hypothetical protein